MYALNIRGGTTINHPTVKLPGLVAVPVDDKLANQLKNITDVIVFKEVKGRSKEDDNKYLYGVNKNTLEIK